ncbi:MAG: VWA domain-containing protein [Alphaproteobacteria bacterium]|nr:VWA domain-containing protein [Alphaproteobacteria bacterium]
MSGDGKKDILAKDGAAGVAARPSSTGEIDNFIAQTRSVPAGMARSGRGQLIFALDATMSRQPAWDMAQTVQGRMFEAAAARGGLDVQLVYFRGFGECRASRFVAGGEGLAALMSKISVRGGETPIGKVLAHTREEAQAGPVGALIYIGDAMEENADRLCQQAGELALLGVKAFMFHEGDDLVARQCFQEIARITGGAYAAFDASAPGRLASLLAAAAAYASGGRAALADQARKGDAAAQLLLTQMRAGSQSP